MRHLGLAGLATLRTRLDRIEVLASLEGATGWSRAYLSNLIDYESPATFQTLLRQLAAAAATRPLRTLVNSTRRGGDPHPALRPLLESGELALDLDATRHLHSRDRIGVYPGLMVLELGG